MSDAERIGPLAETIMAAEPKWNPCSRCGAETSGTVCFDCYRKQDSLREARSRTESSVPPAFRWARFGRPELADRLRGDAASIDSAISAVGARRVVLVGPSGAGKTSLAVAMMRERTDATAEPSMFVLATDLHNCKARSKLGHEPDLIASAVNAPMLVLDDLGTEPLDRAGAVVEVVFHRHTHDLPTIITTWLGDDETKETRGTALANRYGDGFARRVVGDAKVIHLRGAP